MPPRRHAACDVDDVFEARALEDAGGDGGAVAAAADQRQRRVAGQFGEVFDELAAHDVARPTDVAALPLVVGADVHDVHRRLLPDLDELGGRELADVGHRIAGRNPLLDPPLQIPPHVVQTDARQRAHGLLQGSLREPTSRIGVS